MLREEDEGRAAELRGNLRAEVREHAEVRLERLRRVEIVAVAAAPAERLARRLLESRHVHAARAQRLELLHRVVVADDADELHGREVARRRREERRRSRRSRHRPCRTAFRRNRARRSRRRARSWGGDEVKVEWWVVGGGWCGDASRHHALPTAHSLTSLHPLRRRDAEHREPVPDHDLRRAREHQSRAHDRLRLVQHVMPCGTRGERVPPCRADTSRRAAARAPRPRRRRATGKSSSAFISSRSSGPARARRGRSPTASIDVGSISPTRKIPRQARVRHLDVVDRILLATASARGPRRTTSCESPFRIRKK